MKMKHFAIGFVFNKAKDAVLLIEKRKPKWQAGYWNGPGGKIEIDETPLEAINREFLEETGDTHIFEHAITFVCPGGTVFVFKAISEYEEIMFDQLEIEQLKMWPVSNLPENIVGQLKWLIPVCLSTIQFPLLVLDTTLGVSSAGEK